MEWMTDSIQLFQKGGPVMYVLLACSLFIVAAGIERCFYYRQSGREGQAVLRNVQGLLEKQQWNEALQYCEHSSHIAARVAKAGLAALQRGSQIDAAVESAAALAAVELRERLNDLSMIVTLAPLLGLLGTVIGMIHSFSVFNVQAGQPMAISGGVGEALVATATGLCVATLALLLHSLLARWANVLITDVEQMAGLVVGYTAIKKAGRRAAHEIA